MGKVLSCDVVEEESRDREGGTTTWYNPVVRYAYNAGGRDLESSRLRFGNYRSSSRKKAEACLARYSAGGSTPVRYNPDKPEECVIETTKPGPLYMVMPSSACCSSRPEQPGWPRADAPSPHGGEGWGEGVRSSKLNLGRRAPSPYLVPAGERDLTWSDKPRSLLAGSES